jgi:hypothetical protein
MGWFFIAKKEHQIFGIRAIIEASAAVDKVYSKRKQ